jgi:outer membrane immunogenic protein
VAGWTGCYVGVHAGGGRLFDTVTSVQNGGGGLAGAQLGCNTQDGPFVLGLEGEAAWSGLTDRFHTDAQIPGFVSITDATLRNRWSADVAARAGIAVERALVYGKVGVAAGRFERTLASNPGSEFSDSETTQTGLLLGAGVEFAVAPGWSAKLEYNHIDYFGKTVSFVDTATGPNLVTQAAVTDTVKLGVNYRLGDGAPLLATGGAAAGPAITKAPVYKAPNYKAPATAVASWTGCYVGVHAGGGLLVDTFITTADGRADNNGGGGLAGGQLGCNYQAGAIVLGLEGEAAWSRIHEP